MAIDPHAPPGPAKAAPSSAAIENEIPTYRAISSLAVASLILGLIAGLSFADYTFLIASALAVVTGALALLKIRRQPDALTGVGFAQAGITLGLAFGLSAVTYNTVQDRLISSRASAFVRNEVLPVLNDRDLDGALWLRSAPEDRRGITPEQVRQRLTEQMNSNPMVGEMAFGDAGKLIRALGPAGGEGSIRFVKIEQVSLDGITPAAIALLEVDVPHVHDHAPGEAHDHSDDEEPVHAAVRVKAKGDGREQSWWVEDYVYPYKPQSYVAKQKPIDDGHGHAH